MAIDISSAQLAVLGTPISHSQSPRIHAAAYEHLGLPWTYVAHECDTQELENFLKTRTPDWRGLSITMPLKTEAHRLATVRDPIATESGVVNTLLRVIDGPDGAQWAGFNTDVAGLAAALSGHNLDPTHTVVLGAGATAVSAVMAARSLGAQRITVVARRSDAAQELAARFDGTAHAGQRVSVVGIGCSSDVCVDSGVTLVISTLPGSAGAAFEIPERLLQQPLFDVAYDPWPSPLSERWLACGAPVIAGIDMLVEQAIVQVRIFVTGDPHTPVQDEAAMREHMRHAGMGR